MCLQVLPPDAAGRPVTFWAVTQELLRREGVRGLWSGLGARVLTIGPGAAISWMLYEEMKAWLREHC